MRDDQADDDVAVLAGQRRAVAGRSPDLSAYANARYGYAVCYLFFMTGRPEAPNGDGRTFGGLGGAELAVFGRNNPDGVSLADTVRDDAADLAGPGGRISYHVQKGDWAVFSGTTGPKRSTARRSSVATGS